jgi:hypothetical protein
VETTGSPFGGKRHHDIDLEKLVRSMDSLQVESNTMTSIAADMSPSPDDWGFFVDLAPEHETFMERKFLNGFAGTGQKRKPRPIRDSGF